MLSLADNTTSTHGVTLIELIIVVAVMGILLTTAVPSYKSYMLRVHRTEAIRLLLQASMCQQRVRATKGYYDTNRCLPAIEPQRYQFSFDPPNTQGASFLAMATPKGAQRSDTCGSLTMDQNGNRGINMTGAGVAKCWHGR